MGGVSRLVSARDDFEFEAYRAQVSDARRGGLVICHAIWGVTPHLCGLADSYAQDGYEVLVPNLFARQGMGFADRDVDPVLQPRQDAFAKAVNWGEGTLDLVQAAIDALKAPVFLTGFCFGGTVAWLAASRCAGLSAVSSFYGGQIFMFLEDQPKVPTILHLGKTDPLIPPAEVEAIREAHPDLPVYMYDAGHAFVAPNGFHEDSARLSRLRTLALFSRNGGGRGEGA
jgi:carboxymethylenebutenolidase